LFSHIFVSVKDFSRALDFYTPLMERLGIQQRFCDRSKPWAGWQSDPGPRPLFVIGKPFDGQAHVAGNGQMVAFLAPSRDVVEQAFAVALANGGTSEGEPGMRPEYHQNYYGAYFRDPEGNKLCVACHVPGGVTEFDVVPAEAAHLPAIYEVIDSIARERKYLGFTKAPPWEQSLAFYRSLLDGGCPYFVALSGNQVVGWCDVSPLPGDTRSHIGVLGMGLLPTARQKGVGRRLMEAAIAKAWSNGLTRIELTVRDDNLNAKALYESLGFQVEGLRRKGSVIGDEAHDVWAMALLR
jgi:ribosomal protein S18 acetylase RimI-like enzyme